MYAGMTIRQVFEHKGLDEEDIISRYGTIKSFVYQEGADHGIFTSHGLEHVGHSLSGYYAARDGSTFSHYCSRTDMYDVDFVWAVIDGAFEHGKDYCVWAVEDILLVWVANRMQDDTICVVLNEACLDTFLFFQLFYLVEETVVPARVIMEHAASDFIQMLKQKPMDSIVVFTDEYSIRESDVSESVYLRFPYIDMNEYERGTKAEDVPTEDRQELQIRFSHHGVSSLSSVSDVYWWLARDMSGLSIYSHVRWVLDVETTAQRIDRRIYSHARRGADN